EPLPPLPPTEEERSTHMAANPKLEHGRVVEIPVANLMPDPNQPRKSIDKDELGKLAKSIEALGVLQPLPARRTDSVRGPDYVIVSGERRWRAAKLAKLKTVPCILASQVLADGVGRAAAQLAENVARAELDAMEIAE